MKPYFLFFKDNVVTLHYLYTKLTITMKKAYIFILSTLTFMACTSSHNSKMYGELAKADSLLMKELPDSAYKELIMLGQPAKNDRECKAYHALLVTQARYLLYMSTDSCADIDYAIEYYKETEDKEKLARALHWKAGLLSETDRYLEAIEAEKEAEANISKITDPMFCIRIYDNISWLNNKTGNHSLAKNYAFKALRLSEKIKDEKRIAEMYYRISCTYTGLEKVDSALYHIEKALPFINYTTLKPSIILQVALCYRNTRQWIKAENFIKRNAEIKQSAKSQEILGDIYIHTGRADEGVAILQKILPELSGTDKWQAMQLIEDVMMKQGRHAEAAQLQEAITLLKDSIAKEKQTTEALAVQKKYDRKAARDKAIEATGTPWLRDVIVGGMCAIIAALLFWSWYWFFKKRKHDREMTEAMDENTKAQKKIDEAEEKIMEVKAENDRKKEEIDSLNKKIKKDKLQTAQAVIRGKELYDKICTDENFSITDSNDYADIIAYYNTVKPDFFAEKEKQYRVLTDYNKCILLFKEEKHFDNDRICRICRISAGTLRTLMSRIKSRQHETEAYFRASVQHVEHI